MRNLRAGGLEGGGASGGAPRYPGLPAGSYLLSMTPGLVEPVLRAGAELGFEVRPLTRYLAGR